MSNIILVVTMSDEFLRNYNIMKIYSLSNAVACMRNFVG